MEPPGSTRKHRTGRALRSKSLLGRAPQPPAARNRCSGVPRSLLAFEITSRARFFVFGNTRNHCSAALRSHRPLEIAARACRGASWRSKSPLEHAFSCSATPANAAPALALGAAARASVVGFDNAFAFPAESLSKSLSESLCFELCIASSCALRDSTGTVRCHMRI